MFTRMVEGKEENDRREVTNVESQDFILAIS